MSTLTLKSIVCVCVKSYNMMLILCISMNKANYHSELVPLHYVIVSFMTRPVSSVKAAYSPPLHPCQYAPSQGAATKTGSRPSSARLQRTISACSDPPKRRRGGGQGGRSD